MPWRGREPDIFIKAGSRSVCWGLRYGAYKFREAKRKHCSLPGTGCLARFLDSNYNSLGPISIELRLKTASLARPAALTLAVFILVTFLAFALTLVVPLQGLIASNIFSELQQFILGSAALDFDIAL